VKILEKNKIKISMTENGDPLENAIAERVNGILKDELLDDKYADYQIAQNEVAIAVSIYNYERPHSSIEFLTPVEAHKKSGILERKWKNYYHQKEYTAA
jgi:putative transposase